MKITVAICTWNRSVSLACTLAKLADCASLRFANWEVLVVNNNCRDDTDAVAMSFAGRLPLRLISQPVPGLSNARNAAVAAATGEYMVWTDDDVLVESNWLRAYEAAFLAHPEYAFFG